MPELKIYHCFARSGGTLVNRLLGSMRDVQVLSEVGPRAAVRPALDQAIDWLGLVNEHERESAGALSFPDLLGLLAERSAARGAELVVRDFPTPSYLDGAFGSRPAPGHDELADELQAAGIGMRRVAVVRRSAAVYHSLRSSFPHLRDLDLDRFGVAYHQYACEVAPLPRIHYESLTAEPDLTLKQLCSFLGIGYDAACLETFAGFDRCTGDMGVHSRGAGLSGVTSLPDPVDAEDYRAAAGHALCREADQLLGYNDADVAEPVDGAYVREWARVAAQRTGLYDEVTALREDVRALVARAEAAERLMLKTSSELEQAFAREAADRLVRERTFGELARAESLAASLDERSQLLFQEIDRLQDIVRGRNGARS